MKYVNVLKVLASLGLIECKLQTTHKVLQRKEKESFIKRVVLCT